MTSLIPNRLPFLVVLLFASSLLGCSSPGGVGPGMTPGQAALQELADLLRVAEGPQGRPPAKVADLSKMGSQFPTAYQGVKSGDIVVVWGTPMKGEGQGSGGDDKLVAYEKATPTEGGFVLLNSGVVNKVSASEFGGLPKGK